MDRHARDWMVDWSKGDANAKTGEIKVTETEVVQEAGIEMDHKLSKILSDLKVALKNATLYDKTQYKRTMKAYDDLIMTLAHGFVPNKSARM